MKNLPAWMTTVTPISKVIAAVLFVTLPFAGFLLGTQYSNNSSSASNTSQINTTATVVPTTYISTKGGDGDPSIDYLYDPTLDITLVTQQVWQIKTLSYGKATCSYLGATNFKSNSPCKDLEDNNRVFLYNDPNYIPQFDKNGSVTNFPKQFIVLDPFPSDGVEIFCAGKNNGCGTESKEKINVFFGTNIEITHEDKNFDGYSQTMINTGTYSRYKSFRISEIHAVDQSGFNTIKDILEKSYTGK